MLIHNLATGVALTTQVDASSFAWSLPEVVQTIFFQYLLESDLSAINALSCLNKNCNKVVEATWGKSDLLKQYCPSGLTITDAESMGVVVDDEPVLKNRQIMECFSELSRSIENDGGVTLLTVSDSIFKRYIDDASESKTGYKFQTTRQDVLEKIRRLPIEKTHRILIANGIVNNTRGENYQAQMHTLGEIKCTLPTIHELILLCISSHKLFQKCLFGPDQNHGARSSTIDSPNLYLTLENFDGSSLKFSTPYFDHSSRGTGGKKSFS